MVRKRTKESKYRGLSLHTEIVNLVEERVKHDHRYDSITDFVKWAIIEKLKNEKQSPKVKSSKVK